MKTCNFALASAALILAAPLQAEPHHDVEYGPAPAWVRAAPADASANDRDGAILRIVYNDEQEMVNRGVVSSYSAFRLKILKPEALEAGNLVVAWSPNSSMPTVHFVRIIRDGTTIDVLKTTKFRVIERETNLEQSMLDGTLTATLQVPDLRVGDELEFAATLTGHEPVFGTHSAGLAALTKGGVPGTFRYRLLWPAGMPLATRVSKDLPVAAVKQESGMNVLQVELKDPPSAGEVEGAPPRYKIGRTIEFSDFAGWPDLSKQMWPLFDTASQLKPDSPLKAEIAKIAAMSKDPGARAEAALRLVEEQVRYVYVGLNGGNYIPASADETWRRRFGDCKAKTALLLAILRGLDIPAEPVLVASTGGDGTNERLPDPALFDHVLVRATIGGKPVWLDGTRRGDRYLDMLPAPAFEWGLPLSAHGSDLAGVAATTSATPQTISVVDIDATGGFDKDARWTVEDVLHGDEAYAIDSTLATASKADANRAIRSYFRKTLSDVEPDEVSWRYDERHASVALSMKGTGKLDWDGGASDGHQLSLPGGGFYAPDKMQRPKDQDQSAPWAVDYPRFRCHVTTVHLPTPGAGFQWTYNSKPMNRRLAGVIYWRQAGLQNKVVRTVMSSQAFTRELSASEAAETNAQIPTFDNYMSTVEETRSPPHTGPLPFTAEADWTADPAPCSPH